MDGTCTCISIVPHTTISQVLLVHQTIILSETTNFSLHQIGRVYKNFKFNENGTEFSKMVENSLGKGDIARYEQFSPFPGVFSKDLY